MSKVYLTYNNIIASLGFTTAENIENVSKGISGINKVEDRALSRMPFYSSLIDTDKLNTAFQKIGNTNDFTRLEKMMLLSLNDVIEQSNIEITSKTGLIISTTKGNVDVLDADSKFPKERTYLAELGKQIQHFFGFKNEAIVLSNACVSGILAVSVAKRLIQSEMYDNVLVVSGDIVSEFILSGFQSFQAISESPCKPFSKNRTGINIGEAAASILVTSKNDNLPSDAVEILGDGSCNDANHISGPSRTGEGLYRSMQSAFKEANIKTEAIDYISAHGTATEYNDEMESIAFNRIGLTKVPVNSLKGYYGHTLGASGLVETIVGMQSLHNNTLYASFGFDNLGVSQSINVIKETTAKPLTTFLKTASGFGGCNTAAIFKKVL
ncbi:beta-ketoacyl synthase N-terminal-like domain-containing protein [Aureibaculum sp. 2210JD6-5]|uniref:beta-ketoacyl synthase N-terminal-like domain-containing protein n=1 Tax=Aureibaculum sp. 2210JD6-5 TaxID=3103957 RepID=UPI002AADC8CB|nr:beta-ketoacyl synthase N-terminal-like domain-containing protein [Aureibaculum sp. 2210JD6-5]MDY7393871.1 beta-ketoacyl synthase N-terminal-like domain-containing protein [Aureibaculum sp. 2210JD6-5]